MTGTSTMTRTGLRLELVSLEMQSLNDRSMKDELLGDVIAYCVPRKFLANFTIYGMEGGDSHMRLEAAIDYDEHEEQVRLSGDGLPDGVAGSYALADGPAGAGPARPDHCPHMGKALDLYIRLVKEKGLQLLWTVSFREKRREMCEKFGLVPVVIHDCTLGGLQSTVTNSLYSELTIVGRVSPKVLPRE